MKLPKTSYGIANFVQLREGKYLYVDKTRYIETLENMPPYQFLIRPRRFGKSLFVSTLYNYYDMNMQSRFEEFFGDLYVGKHPTPMKNGYLIMFFSFAGIATTLGKDRLIDSFDHSVYIEVNSFLERNYHRLGVDQLEDKEKNAEKAIRKAYFAAHRAGYKIFLLIDEYDNFANDLISTDNQQLYYDLLHGEGYVRSFYKAIKEGCQLSIERVFMTGVSPVMLDDLASGFNITTNFTFLPALNEILGFTQQDVDDIFARYDFPKEETQSVLKDLKFFYNGYLFHKNSTSRLYNSDMILYFLEWYKEYRTYPDTILDNNVRTDYNKIRQIALKYNDNEIIEEILAGEQILTNIIERFPLDKMYNDNDNFHSLLLYLGMLTIHEPYREKVKINIPNHVIKTIYWDYFVDFLKSKTGIIKSLDVSKLVAIMQEKGDIQPFLSFVSQVLETLSNRDLMSFNEKYIKAIFLTLIHLDGLYVIASERETHKGYIDILLLRDIRYAQYINYEWLIEIKYLKKSEYHTLDAVRKMGLEQIQNYSFADDIESTVDMKSLKRALLVFSGKNKIDTYFPE